jgi:hypothetical protein
MPGHGESFGFNEEQLIATNVVDELKQVLRSKFSTLYIKYVNSLVI